MKTSILALVAAACLFAAAPAAAESYQVAWNPVTGYSDGAPFEAGKTVTYSVYWTRDPSFAPASLQPIVSDRAVTSASFDVSTIGMVRGETVYFLSRSTLSTGEVSDLSSGLSWTVPRRRPSVPGNSRVIKIK